MTVLELRTFIKARCTYDEVAKLLGITPKALTRKLGYEKNRKAFTDDEISHVVDLLKDYEVKYLIDRTGTRSRTDPTYRGDISKKLIHEDNEHHWIYQLVTAMGYTLAEASIKLGHCNNYLAACMYNEKIGKRPIPADLHRNICEKL